MGKLWSIRWISSHSLISPGNKVANQRSNSVCRTSSLFSFHPPSKHYLCGPSTRNDCRIDAIQKWLLIQYSFIHRDHIKLEGARGTKIAVKSNATMLNKLNWGPNCSSPGHFQSVQELQGRTTEVQGVVLCLFLYSRKHLWLLVGYYIYYCLDCFTLTEKKKKTKIKDKSEVAFDHDFELFIRAYCFPPNFIQYGGLEFVACGWVTATMSPLVQYDLPALRAFKLVLTSFVLARKFFWNTNPRTRLVRSM